MTLFFLYQPGCAACASMEPFVTKLEARGLTVIRRNVNIVSEVMGWTPRATPGFALMDRGVLMKTHEGTMTVSELDHFADPAYTPPPRRRKKTAPRARKPAAPVADEDEDDADDDNEDESEGEE